LTLFSPAASKTGFLPDRGFFFEKNIERPPQLFLFFSQQGAVKRAASFPQLTAPGQTVDQHKSPGFSLYMLSPPPPIQVARGRQFRGKHAKKNKNSRLLASKQKSRFQPAPPRILAACFRRNYWGSQASKKNASPEPWPGGDSVSKHEPSPTMPERFF